MSFYSIALYEGDGSTVDYTVSFPYLEQDHVLVEVDGIAASFTFPSESIARLDVAPTTGAVVKLYRNPQSRQQDDLTLRQKKILRVMIALGECTTTQVEENIKIYKKKI